MSLPGQPPASVGAQRPISLDALLGFAMFWIVGGRAILLGLGEGWQQNEWFQRTILPQIQHTDWEGFTAWDLVMPLLLFALGAAMPFSFRDRLERGEGKARRYRHVLLVTVVLWVLGLAVEGRLLEYDLSALRLYSNTLQAIAAGYLISSLLLWNLRPRWQLVATAGLLVLYWDLLALVPLPGYGEARLTPNHNLALYIDKWVLGPFWDGTETTRVLTSISYAGTVMMGALAGQLLRSNLGKARKTLFLLACGVACVYLGWGWGHLFPIVKRIWTSSMALYAGGWSLILLGLFYLALDVLRLRFLGFFFVVIGGNAIAAYVAARLFDFRILGDIFVGSLAPWTGPSHEFTRAVAGLAILWLILLYLYRKQTFTRI
jgi:predicted acyltransferase